MWRALGTASPAWREKPFVCHRGTFIRLTRRFALQGGDCVIVFPRGRRVEFCPVALIRPSATFSRVAGEAVWRVCYVFGRLTHWGGESVDVFARDRRVEFGPVALIRPSATFSRGAGEAVWCVCCGFDRPPTGGEIA